MNERTIFLDALDKNDPTERSAFLDTACAGDEGLRRRVDSLLKSHVEAGSFLGKLAPERVAEELALKHTADETQGEVPESDKAGANLEFLAPSDKPDVLGRIAHYDILEVIGRGGMGVVLRAFDEKLHRVVAIKVMAAQLAANGTARKRFTREAQAAAAVSHDHIVTIHAVEETAGHPYLVMQYVSGMSLQERLDRNGPLQLAEIVRIGMQTAAGLAAAHAQGLVHRDVKPANILLENGIERVKVTDFGLARAAADASLTQSGVIAGTPYFMSPEQARGEPVDQRTDLFSLGSVLYAMCTGRAPFRASGTMAVLKRVCEETPRPIRETNPEVPDWLVAIIDRLHAKDPAGRYQTAAEVAELLNQHLAHLQHPSIVRLPVSGPAKPAVRRRRIVAALALLSLIAVLIVLTAVLPRLRNPEETPIVKDSPEGKRPSPGTSGKPDPHPFVVLGGKEVAERKFDTLADAVQGASDGDTIEIRGNGPFVSGPMRIAKCALTIRAGEGFRPVIKRSPASIEEVSFWDLNAAALVLEGLEFQGSPESKNSVRSRIHGWKASFRAANCRFRVQVKLMQAPVCEFRNCELLIEEGWGGFHHYPGSGGRVLFENCLCRTGGLAMKFHYENAPIDDVSIQVTRSTFVCKNAPLELSLMCPVPADVNGPRVLKPICLDVSRSVFDSSGILAFSQHKDFTDKAGVLPPAEAEATFLCLLEWRGERNLFPAGNVSVQWRIPPNLQPPRGPKSLEEWKKLWGSKEADSWEGRPRFQGGNLVSRSEAELDKITPEDFRLRPDSPGFKAGKDGKDLGADVDLVGPGPAYERWKKTPEYQQWLKDTKQVTKTSARKAESKAFVVLGGQGVAERKFDSLADAVLTASDGDTIEIRGNGPFVIKPIDFKVRAIIIRAGAGFWPVIKADPDEQGTFLLRSKSLLVLEGLDLQWVEAKPYDPSDPQYPFLVSSTGPKARLCVVNCRFLMNRRDEAQLMACITVSDGTLCQLRNCQLLVGGHGSLGRALVINPKTTAIVDNCLTIDQGIQFDLRQPDPTKVFLNHNTVLGPVFTVFYLKKKIDGQGGDKDARPYQIVSAANIFGGRMQFTQLREFLAKEKALNAKDTERLMTQLVGWQDSRNLYSSPEDSDLLVLFAATTAIPPTVPLKTLLDWKNFWGLEEMNSQRGQAKFQGGDLVARAMSAPERILPKDFRLRADSAGYQAGKDGKDLGADVDLVGPGPAYERWKKTPAYQQWLKDMKQAK